MMSKCPPPRSPWLRTLPPAPPPSHQVVVVNMTAGSALSAAVCQRLCVGRAVGRCAALRAAVAAMGGDGSAGGGLAEALAAPTAGGGWGHEGEGGERQGPRPVACVWSLGQTCP